MAGTRWPERRITTRHHVRLRTVRKADTLGLRIVEDTGRDRLVVILQLRPGVGALGFMADGRNRWFFDGQDAVVSDYEARDAGSHTEIRIELCRPARVVRDPDARGGEER